MSSRAVSQWICVGHHSFHSLKGSYPQRKAERREIAREYVEKNQISDITVQYSEVFAKLIRKNDLSCCGGMADKLQCRKSSHKFYRIAATQSYDTMIVMEGIHQSSKVRYYSQYHHNMKDLM